MTLQEEAGRRPRKRAKTKPLSFKEAARRRRQAAEAASPPPPNPRRVYTIRQWCALNNISLATGKRIIARGEIKVTDLSERCKGIREDHNAEWQDTRIRIGK
jgi:hypothetical protein